MSPITAYLEELSARLRRGARRRVLAEVRGHLLEAAAADCERGEDPQLAQQRAVTRFGAPEDVARQFNAVRRRPRALVQRAAAALFASAAMASLGSATVWALEPGHAHHVHHHHAAGHHRLP